ncbi:uncharacterized protein C7orf50 homolog [Episyrphus balteatus]|uniref:uncharacterized protein C7orf50 homolog n=1 Tax=Episyrphus balteatus TaxID=286459 RepID=UPI0024865881|nr:uncharacterized protein C7orf50 homolog [Episyrphus balteatus]
MAKINKSPEESLKKSKSPKKKNKLEKNDVSNNKKSSPTDPEKLPATKKQIKKKPKIKSNGMKQAVSLIAADQKKHKKQQPLAKADDDDENEDEFFRGPTTEQLLESEKPENIKAILTVRQKKKLKHQQRLEEQKNKCPNKEIARNQEYLLKWKNNREDWKFEKLRQIGVQTTVFDDTKISAEVWPIALEYLSGSKGAAKEKITKAAEAVIDELDKEAEKAGDGGNLITSSEKYRRARELLQSFD